MTGHRPTETLPPRSVLPSLLVSQRIARDGDGLGFVGAPPNSTTVRTH